MLFFNWQALLSFRKNLYWIELQNEKMSKKPKVIKDQTKITLRSGIKDFYSMLKTSKKDTKNKNKKELFYKPKAGFLRPRVEKDPLLKA